MSFLEFLQTSFFHVLPILLAGAFATAILIERVRALFYRYPIPNQEGFLKRVQELVLAGKPLDAVSLCDQHPGKPAASIVKSALLRAHQPEDLIKNGIELSLGEAVQSIQKRTSFLATIANVATLLGLFGTIAGLIQSFEAVGHADPQQKSELLANGIATAMNATMLGLGVAIPCMVAFSFLINRSNRLIAELENTGLSVMDTIQQSYYTDDQITDTSGDSSRSAA